MDLHFLKRTAQQYELEQFPVDDEFQLIVGQLPVVISTPHSVTHFREGKPKFGEFMTAAIAQALHQLVGCSYITKLRNNQTDPNYDAQHPYKDCLVQFATQQHVQLVLDLHIMSSKRAPSIEIGTAHGRNVLGKHTWVEQLQNAFRLYAIKPVVVDQLFTAGNPNTVCSTVARRAHVPTIQLEINWRLLDTTSEQQQIEAVVQALAHFLHSFDVTASF